MGIRPRGPGASCCIFHLENPFSRFSVATGARARKSNARCPLVNLRVNTHRRDNLRSRQVHSRSSSASRFFRPPLCLFLPLVSFGRISFSDRTDVGARASRKAKPVRTPRYTGPIVMLDVDMLIICDVTYMYYFFRRRDRVCYSLHHFRA